VFCASASSPGDRVVRYAPPPHSNFTSTFAKRLCGFRAVNAAQWNESQNTSMCSEELCIMSVNTGRRSDDKIRRQYPISLPSSVTQLLLERLNQAKLKREWCVVRISRREMHTGSWCGNLKERAVLQRSSSRGNDNVQ